MQTLHEAPTHTLPVTQPPIQPPAATRPKPRFRYAISAPVTTMVLGLVAISGVEIAAWTTPTNTVPASVVSTSGPTFTSPAAKPKVVQVAPTVSASPSAVPTHLHAATVPQDDPTTDPPSTDPTVDPTSADPVLQPPAPAPVRTHSGPPAPPSSPPAAPVTPEPAPTTAEPTPTDTTPPASSEPSTP